MMNVIACPTRDFGPHDPSRNLGTANSRSKPYHINFSVTRLRH
jgi:hypothetical protein